MFSIIGFIKSRYIKLLEEHKDKSLQDKIDIFRIYSYRNSKLDADLKNIEEQNKNFL